MHRVTQRSGVVSGRAAAAAACCCCVLAGHKPQLRQHYAKKLNSWIVREACCRKSKSTGGGTGYSHFSCVCTATSICTVGVGCCVGCRSAGGFAHRGVRSVCCVWWFSQWLQVSGWSGALRVGQSVGYDCVTQGVCSAFIPLFAQAALSDGQMTAGAEARPRYRLQ